MQADIGAVCLSHLEFMKWADERFLAALFPLPTDKLQEYTGTSFKSMLGTLSHVYLAELVWLKRVQGFQDAQIADLRNPATLAILGESWPATHQDWIEWAHPLTLDDWLKPLKWRNSAGVESQLPHWQVVLHLVNHGSYHRGQIATMLRQSGIAPPGTDLVTFYRTR
jgi:uncharacterized damage-inducible protein DinB